MNTNLSKLKYSFKLIKPSEKYFSEIREYKTEFFINHETRIQGSGALEKYDNLEEWLKSIKEIENGLNPLLVKTTYYLLIDEKSNKIIGTICFRHQLTDELERNAGHIGYSIRPSERKKGYATLMLKMLLEMINKDVLIMAEKDNVASNKVIKKCSGIFLEQISAYNILINRYLIKKEN